MAGTISIVITVLLVFLYIPNFTHGFLCIVKNVKPGLKYDGTHRNIHGVHVGASQPFRCYDMYQDSRTELTCVRTYTWSDPSPPCKLKTCVPPISLINGTVDIQGHEVGNLAIYNCHKGFWYRGENPRICQKNNTWTGTDGSCVEVTCSPPDAPFNGRLSPGPPYKYKSIVKVYCNAGFAHNGSQKLVCLGKNKWKGKVGECLDTMGIQCKTFLPPGNATVNTSSDELGYGENIQIACPKGSTYNGTARRTCQLNGTWTGYGGSCHVITCPPYVPVGGGWSEPACSPCVYKDAVRVVCPQGYATNGAEVICDEHGTWSGVIEECSAIRCDEDIGIPHGSITGYGFMYLGEGNIKCDPGYQWEGELPKAVCSSNGTWTYTGACIEKTFVEKALDSLDAVPIVVPITVVLSVLMIVGLLLWLKVRLRKRFQQKSAGSDEEMERLINTDEGVGAETINKSIKEAVLEGGHVINRHPDKKIDLDTQFITLRLVGGGGNQGINDFLPDRYQDYLQKAGGQNIEIEDLLNHIKEKRIPIESTVVNENKSSSRKSPQLLGEAKYKIGEVRQRVPLLLEGRGGVGKSTLVQKLMRLWAQNKWAKNYKAAFLFNIRSLTVVDKRPVSLVDFFKYFGVYILRDKTDSFTTASLKDQDKVIIFMDGIDEFAGLANKLHKRRNKSIKMKAEPLTWCLDILCRDVLGESVLILASRPFKDLAAVCCDPVLEVVGLTRDAILDFIDHHVKADCIERVRKAMTGNNLVMSVSAITYFCMLFCQVLEEDDNVSMEELTTYTRIAAFFVQNYLSRCPKDQFSGVEPSSCLPPLASLAYNGLVTNRANYDIARLVFDENDLRTINMIKKEVEMAGDCGILLAHSITQHREDQSEPETCFTYEFVHLSVQELLAMMELSQKGTHTLIKTAEMMWKSSSFNMAKMYLYGLHFDTESESINKLIQMIHLKVEKHKNDEDDRLIDIITMANNDKSAEVESKDLLQILQVTYETQNKEVMKKVAERTFKESTELKLSKTLLTAIDMNAVIFMLKHIRHTNTLCLTEVTMDETCVELLSGYLKIDAHLTELSMEGTQLSTPSIRNIMESFGCQPHQKSLNLSRTGIDENSMSVLVDRLSKASSITTLSLAGNGLCSKEQLLELINILPHTSITKLSLPKQNKDSALAVAAALSTDTSLHSISLQCDWEIGRYDETILAVMKELIPNKMLQFMWLTDEHGITNTLVCEPGTGRRVRVEAGSRYTSIHAWILADISSSPALRHDGVEWGGDGLWLHLNEFSSIYGEDCPVVSPDVWLKLLHDVTQCKHRVRRLEVYLSPSSPLTPLLTSITSHWGALIHKQVEEVRVWYGEVTCCDLHTWYTSLTTQPGWSVRGRYEGAEITNTHGQSVVIRLWLTRITFSHQDHRHSLEQAPGLLLEPKWV